MSDSYLQKRILSIVEKQMTDRTPPQVNITYRTLRSMGYDSSMAKQIIGQAVADTVYAIMIEGKEYDEASYICALQKIENGEFAKEDDHGWYDDDFDDNWEDEWSDEEEELPAEFLWEVLFEENNINELKELAAKLNIRFKKKSARQLAEEIACRLLEPDFFRESFLCLHDDMMETMDELMANGSMEGSRRFTDQLFNNKHLSMYLNCDYYDHITTTKDVVEAYYRMVTPEFTAARKKMTWLSDCLITFQALYGAAPIRVFTDLYNTHPQYSVSEEDTMDLLKESGQIYSKALIQVNDELRSKNLQKNNKYKELMRLQGNCEFEIPSYQEIRDLGTYLYPASDPAYKQLKELFEESENLSLDLNSMTLLKHLFAVCSQNIPLEKGLSVFAETENGIPEEDCDLFEKLFIEIARSTRSLLQRGKKQPDCKVDEVFLHQMMKKSAARAKQIEILLNDEDDLPF